MASLKRQKADGTYEFVEVVGMNVVQTLELKAPLASPTFTGTAKTTTNENYTTSQLRNVKFDTVIPTALENGEICFVYE